MNRKGIIPIVRDNRVGVDSILGQIVIDKDNRLYAEFIGEGLTYPELQDVLGNSAFNILESHRDDVGQVRISLVRIEHFISKLYRTPNPIRLKVLTEMTFNNETEFLKFADSAEASVIVGYPQEIKSAWKTQSLVNFETPRPEYGAVAKSQITVSEIEAKNEQKNNEAKT